MIKCCLLLQVAFFLKNKKQVILMWILYAFGSAIFAGITSILAKCGIKKTDSDTATAIRTIVVLVFACIMAAISGSYAGFFNITPKTWVFLVLSGLATGASWLCYFKALQLGNVNKVVAIDKSSIILTILLAFIVLGETITAVKGGAVLLIGAGTYMMIDRKENTENKASGRAWMWYAFGSAIFASLTSILGKIGIDGVESNLGTAIRTAVVLVMAWLVVAVKGKIHTVKNVPKKELLFICLSGVATGASWLCYYRALKDGLASVVVPVDKLSIVVTVIFSYIVFKDKLSKKAFVGLLFMILGTLLMIF